jgi:hypothetical protein
MHLNILKRCIILINNLKPNSQPNIDSKITINHIFARGFSYGLYHIRNDVGRIRFGNVIYTNVK